jgi:molybdenum cofactor biosynthesis protein B
MSTGQHQQQRVHPVVCAVVTVSDTRTPDTDASGRLIQELLAAAGHSCDRYDIIPDDPILVRERVASVCGDGRVQTVLLTGGTGLSARDTTYEAIVDLFEKRLDGFGELFRMLSYREIGAAAILSRALGGVYRRTAVFSMPGSTPAVRLAMEQLILPTLGHIVALLRNQ